MSLRGESSWTLNAVTSNEVIDLFRFHVVSRPLDCQRSGKSHSSSSALQVLPGGSLRIVSGRLTALMDAEAVFDSGEHLDAAAVLKSPQSSDINAHSQTDNASCIYSLQYQHQSYNRAWNIHSISASVRHRGPITESMAQMGWNENHLPTLFQYLLTSVPAAQKCTICCTASNQNVNKASTGSRKGFIPKGGSVCLTGDDNLTALHR